MGSASGAGLFTIIGFATTSVISFAKPSIGINPTSKINDAKASPAKAPMKSSFSTKAVSLARVSSFINKSGANEPLFFLKVESFTELPILPRQDALESAIKRLTTVPSPIRSLAIPPVTLDNILEAFKSVESGIDFNNLNF